MWERVTSFPPPAQPASATNAVPPFARSTICSSVSRSIGSPTHRLFFSAFMLSSASPSQRHPAPPTSRRPLPPSFSSNISKPPSVRRVTAYFLQPCSPLSPPPSVTQRHRRRATLYRAPLSSLTLQGSSGHRLFISALRAHLCLPLPASPSAPDIAPPFAALLLLQRLKAAKGSSGHHLFPSAFMLAFMIICLPGSQRHWAPPFPALSIFSNVPRLGSLAPRVPWWVTTCLFELTCSLLRLSVFYSAINAAPPFPALYLLQHLKVSAAKGCLVGHRLFISAFMLTCFPLFLHPFRAAFLLAFKVI